REDPRRGTAGRGAKGGLTTMALPELPATRPGSTRNDLVGDSALRPDGVLKVKGEFAFSSDLWADDMLWGVTLRSPHPHARVTHVDTGPALATPGVNAVLTQDAVPGKPHFGLEDADQPVLCDGTDRYHGEPVAIVA